MQLGDPNLRKNVKVFVSDETFYSSRKKQFVTYKLNNSHHLKIIISSVRHGDGCIMLGHCSSLTWTREICENWRDDALSRSVPDENLFKSRELKLEQKFTFLHGRKPTAKAAPNTHQSILHQSTVNSSGPCGSWGWFSVQGDGLA